MLFKVRQYVYIKTKKTIYHAILNYALFVWAQSLWSVTRLLILQKISLRLIIFQKRNVLTSLLFKKLSDKDSNFTEKDSLENCILTTKSLHKLLPKILCDCFFCLLNLAHRVTERQKMVINFPSYHGTKIRGETTCKKIRYCMGDSSCRWLIVENAKIFRSYVKNVLIFPRERNCRILIGLCE